MAVVWAARADDGDGAADPRLRRPDRHARASWPTTSTSKISLRASVTSELVLTDVRLPDSAARCPACRPCAGPLSCLNEARYGILWGATGAGRACYEAALAYAKEREQFGKPIASFQLTQRKLVEMMVRVKKAAARGAAPRPHEGPGAPLARPR